MKHQPIIDTDQCVACGCCVSDCPRQAIAMREKKAAVLYGCNHCGHCFAICPAGAVRWRDSADETLEMGGVPPLLDAGRLKAHLKCRRSIRRYQARLVEKDKLSRIIEAGRLTPSSHNAQNVRYIVLDEELETIEDAALALYKRLSPWAGLLGRFVRLPIDISREKLARGFLFHKAPAAILIVSKSRTNACLAAMSMELMAEALGLGTLHVGLFTAPCNLSGKLRRTLGIARGERVAACLAVGYPGVKYMRSAPKRTADVVWR